VLVVVPLHGDGRRSMGLGREELPDRSIAYRSLEMADCGGPQRQVGSWAGRPATERVTGAPRLPVDVLVTAHGLSQALRSTPI
jgi:hypothetical protein